MTILKWIVPCVVCVCVINICHSDASLTTGTLESNEFNGKGQRAFVSGDVVIKSSPLLVNRVPDRTIREQPPITRTANRQQKLPVASTKLTSTLPPPDDTNNESESNIAEDEEPSVDQNEEEPSPVPSTTEAPKKNKIVGSLRPFRSQQDLVDSLRRRRLMTTQQHGSTTTPTTSTSITEKTQSRNTSRKYGNTNRSPPSYAGEPNSFQRKSSASRRYNAKSTTPAIVEDVDTTEESHVVPQSATRNGRTYTRRTTPT